MIRSEINNKLRGFARTLSPTQPEQKFVSKVYGSLQEMLGEINCIQIGSYPRYTAITPIHDLDILYVLGDWPNSGDLQDPDGILSDVCELITQNYNNFCPDGYSFVVDVQNHSVVISFSGQWDFTVDVVPCYSYGQNAYKQSMYKVPQVIKQRDRLRRRREVWDPKDRNQWISSDPRGYIKQAEDIGVNPDFRKAVKIIKFWKRTLRDVDSGLKLKSFHLEQVITLQFQNKGGLDLIGAIFDFFANLPETIDKPNIIEDRAQPGKYIDDYLADLTDIQKQKIKKARDNVMIGLEELDDDSDVRTIFTAGIYHRDPNEQFLFDYGHIMIADISHEFDISYHEQDKFENRAMRRARKKLRLPKKKELFFKIIDGLEDGLTYFWKVQNSKDLKDRTQRRGEITKHHTHNNPENTEYFGDHYVECFGVNGRDECVRRARCEVAIGADE